jgi:hypothetical protein
MAALGMAGLSDASTFVVVNKGLNSRRKICVKLSAKALMHKGRDV